MNALAMVIAAVLLWTAATFYVGATISGVVSGTIPVALVGGADRRILHPPLATTSK